MLPHLEHRRDWILEATASFWGGATWEEHCRHITFLHTGLGGLGLSPPVPTAAAQYLAARLQLRTEPQPEDNAKTAAEKLCVDTLSSLGVSLSSVLGRDEETLWKDGMQRASKPLQKSIEHRQLQMLKDLGWTSPCMRCGRNKNMMTRLADGSACVCRPAVPTTQPGLESL